MTKNIMILILLLTSMSLAFAQGGPKSKVGTPMPAAVKTSMARGAVIYRQYCLVCHQADGGGVPNMNPPLINTSWVNGEKKPLIGMVLNGFTTNVDIDGQSYSNNMPPQNFLKDQEIADVLTYVRNSFGNKAAAIKALEVLKVRKSK